MIQFLDPWYYFVSGENSLWTMVNTMFHIIVAVSTVHFCPVLSMAIDCCIFEKNFILF